VTFRQSRRKNAAAFGKTRALFMLTLQALILYYLLNLSSVWKRTQNSPVRFEEERIK